MLASEHELCLCCSAAFVGLPRVKFVARCVRLQDELFISGSTEQPSLFA